MTTIMTLSTNNLEVCLAFSFFRLATAPLEDRTAKIRGESVRTTLSGVAWYVFPLMALIFLVAVFVVIVTPFEKHQ